jgi:hypothetical protein
LSFTATANVGDTLARTLHDLQQQARTVLQAAAPAVVAAVGQRRQELAEQVAVRGMDLHAAEPGALGQLGAADEAAITSSMSASVIARGGANCLDSAPISRATADGASAGWPSAAGICRPGWLICIHICRPASGRFGPGDEAVQVAVVFQHHAAGAGHGAAIDHHVAGDDQSGAAVGPALVELQQCSGGAWSASAMFSSIAALAMRLR